MTDFLTIVHECKDFLVWKQAYEADAPRRTSAGLSERHVLRDVAQPNLVGLMFEVADMGAAKAMVGSPELAATMTAAGVTGAPRIRFRTGQYPRNSATGYATISATVQDFDRAMKAYAMDAADRRAASLTDLAVLQEVGSPGNILLLWSVTDVARATAFFDSPSLAEHMVKNAGVVGPPERHFWRV